MSSSVVKTYRLDYLLYIFVIIILDVIAFYCKQSFALYISIGIVWLHMCWLAIKKLQKKQIGTEFFLVFATVISLVGKQEIAIMYVLLIMLFARYVELIVEYQTHHAIENIIKLMPSTVLVLEKNNEITIPIAELQPGMHVLVKTGSRIPVLTRRAFPGCGYRLV